MDLVSTSFLGRSVRVDRAFDAKLAKVQTALQAQYDALPEPKATFKEWHGVYSVGGYREGGSMHGKGRAIDVNYYRNGYVACRTRTARGTVYGGEDGGDFTGVRRAFADACDRACMAFDGQPADTSARKAGETSESVWDRWHHVSESLCAYFAPWYPAIDDLDAGEADHLPDVDPASIPPQIATDYQSLRVPLVVGSPMKVPRLTRNPAKGIMDIPRHTFVALSDVCGFRAGTADFSATSSGDLMHWDDAKRIASGA